MTREPRVALAQQHEEAIRWRRVCRVIMACFGGAAALLLVFGEPSRGPLVVLLGCGLTSLLGAIWYGLYAMELESDADAQLGEGAPANRDLPRGGAREDVSRRSSASRDSASSRFG